MNTRAWSMGSTNGSTRLITIALLAFSVPLSSCNSRYTENANSSVVRLRDDLRELAAGRLNEVRGETRGGDSYVLLYGYQGPLDLLAISETLRERLRALTPYDYERYVLVHVAGDEIKEYTQWAPGDEPLFTRVPFLIRGDPFRIIVEQRKPYEVTIRVE